VPVAIKDLELGDDILEVGPGFGPATEALAGRAPRLTALDIDPHLARSLGKSLAGRAEVVQGDGAAMPFPDARFSAAVCFTMLHHVPSAETQDRLFTEIRRVLRPGAPFAGTDSTGRCIGFALLHIGDTNVAIRPDDLARRLSAAGLEEVAVDTIDRDGYRFRARRPH